MTAKLPRGAVKAGAEALQQHIQGAYTRDPWNMRARVVLEAAMPLIERDVARRMARHVLELDTLHRRKTRNKPPWIDILTSLRKLGRGETLPGVAEAERALQEQEGADA